jgi:hypothetical protein
VAIRTTGAWPSANRSGNTPGTPSPRTTCPTILLTVALYCALGKIDVETDGDTWHTSPAKANVDNLRDNALETAGWRVLRFTTKQIQEEMNVYTLPKIVTNINRLGGLGEGKVIPRQIGPGDNPWQPGLFDEL